MTTFKPKIKKGDTVFVRAGRDKGKSGEVLGVFPDEARVLVRGINMIKKHQKPDVQHPDGGIVAREAKIHISNLGVLDKASGKPSRVGYRLGDDKKKQRILKSSGEVLS